MWFVRGVLLFTLLKVIALEKPLPRASVRTGFHERTTPTESFTLTCSIPFSYPGGVYYAWRASVQGQSRVPSPTLEQTLSSSVVFRIYEDYPPLVRVFCHVIATVNDTHLTFGYVDIEMEGLMSSSSRSSVENNTLRLEVEPNRQYSFKPSLQSLAPFTEWFLNNTNSFRQLGNFRGMPSSTPSPNERINIEFGQPGGRNTLIFDDPEAGVYMARISSFLSEENTCGRNLSCDDLAVALLTHYAVARPVFFDVDVHDNFIPHITFTTLPLLSTTTTTLNITRYFVPERPWFFEFTVPLVNFPSVQYDATGNPPNLQLLVYYNGQRIIPIVTSLVDNLRVPLNFTGLFQLADSSTAIVSLNIPLTRVLDEGTYEVFFRLDGGAVPDLACCDLYQDLLTGQGLELRNFVVGMAVVELIFAREPYLRVGMNRLNISSGESVQLSCHISSLNGPRGQAFKWEKDMQVLNHSYDYDHPLVLSTADVANPYGEYNCFVHNGLHDTRKYLHIAERVNVVYFLEPLGERDCTLDMKEKVQYYMEESLKDAFLSLCDCNYIPDENLFGSRVNCNPINGVMTFEMSVVFANEYGTLLASDLTAGAEQWIVGEKIVNDSRFFISATNMIELPPLPTDGTEAAVTDLDLDTLPTSTWVAVVVCCLFVGVTVSLVLECFMIRCIYVLWKRRQKLKQDAGTVDQPLPMAPPPLTTPHEQNNNRIIISATNFAQELPELVPDTNRPSPSNTVHNPAYNLGQPEVQESNTGLLQREGPQDPMYDYPLVPQLAPDERNMQRLSNEGDMEQSGSYTYEN